MRFLLLLLLLCAAPAQAQLWQELDFGESPSPQTIRAQGAEVTISPRTNRDGDQTALISVRIDGFPTVLDELSAAPFGWKVGIGRISATDANPSVIVQNFSGGAHCCFAATAYVPYAGRVREILIGGGDGDGLSEWPRDIDDDGTIDIESYDNSLLYAFSSYAASYALPTVHTIYRGNLVDVTDEPQFKPIMEAFSRRARAACVDNSLGSERNGGCAAYVVAEARLGRLQPALAFVRTAAYNGRDAVYPYACRVSTSPCPPAQELQFTNFHDGIVWFLRQEGLVN